MKKIVFYALLFLLISCETKVESFEQALQDKNLRVIYDNNTFETFDAVDIKPTDDGGFIILGAYSNTSQNPKIKEVAYLLKIDKQARFEWDTKSDSSFYKYKNPVLGLSVKGNDYYFAASTLDSSVIVKFDAKTKTLQSKYQLENADAIRCTATKDNGFLLLSRKYEPKIAISLHKIGSSFQKTWEKNFPEGYSPKISTQDMKKYYTCGEFIDKNKSYFFCNGFIEDNYGVKNYSMGILDGSTGNLLFTVQLPNTDMMPFQLDQVDDHVFSASFTNFRDTYLTQGFNILIEAGKCEVTNLSLFHEIAPNNLIVGVPAKIKDRNFFIAGMNLRENIIGVYILNPTKENTVLAGKINIGNNKVYEYKSLCRSNDAGLMVLGTTYVGYRFSRICLFKIAKNDLENIVSEK